MEQWFVVIKHGGEVVRLACESQEEARLVRTSFINWGGLGYDIVIRCASATVDGVVESQYNT